MSLPLHLWGRQSPLHSPNPTGIEGKGQRLHLLMRGEANRWADFITVMGPLLFALLFAKKVLPCISAVLSPSHPSGLPQVSPGRHTMPSQSLVLLSAHCRPSSCLRTCLLSCYHPSTHIRQFQETRALVLFDLFPVESPCTFRTTSSNRRHCMGNSGMNKNVWQYRMANQYP